MQLLLHSVNVSPAPKTFSIFWVFFETIDHCSSDNPVRFGNEEWRLTMPTMRCNDIFFLVAKIDQRHRNAAVGTCKQCATLLFQFPSFFVEGMQPNHLRGLCPKAVAWSANRLPLDSARLDSMWGHMES